MIETDRLYLYNTSELKDDWWTFFSELISDADISSMGWDDSNPKKMSHDELNKKKNVLYNQFITKGYGQFAIMCKENNQWIGYCQLRHLDDPSPELIDYYNSNNWNYKDEVELLYGYIKDSWGKGYATEAAKTIIDFGLNKCNIKSISACVNPYNIGSQKILQKIGMKQCENLMYSKPGDLYFKVTR
jgi:ribosomal-protein-alanine N-acetyltransferase